MKCSICDKKINETFLNKIDGTFVFKEGSSKKYPVCFECQKKFSSKKEMLESLK